jgi:glucosamine--fructose-6-phosphate aminotransferase (isomerizing)
MIENDTLMAAELHEAPGVVSRHSQLLQPSLEELSNFLFARPPQVVVTCARGSSAHAANFGKYLIERYLGIPVSAAAPSIATVYKRRLALDGQLFLVISQSGRSDDLVEATLSAREAGARTVAIVNDTASPLAAASHIILPMGAGEELSVAATKTFIASLSALLHLVARWTGERSLLDAIIRLPGRLEEALQLDWTAASAQLSHARSIATIGRGPTLAIAQEASLKLKEVCNIHAEAFSGAEFQHGPIALVSEDFPALIFLPGDAGAIALRVLARDLCRRRAPVYTTSNGPGERVALPVLAPECSETDAVCLIPTFYKLVTHLATRRGMNVDAPRHLRKITRTR